MGRVRRKGGGGKPLSERDPTLVADLRRLVEPATLGSPVQPLRWVSKSREKLARALSEMGHKISANTVGKLLTDVPGFSRQVNRKADEGAHHPERVAPKARFQRDAQFEHINAKVVAAQAKVEPVLSVDTRKKELIGNYKNAGSDYRPISLASYGRCMAAGMRMVANRCLMCSHMDGLVLPSTDLFPHPLDRMIPLRKYQQSAMNRRNHRKSVLKSARLANSSSQRVASRRLLGI